MRDNDPTNHRPPSEPEPLAPDEMVDDLHELLNTMTTTLRTICSQDVAIEVLKTIRVQYNPPISIADLVYESLTQAAEFQNKEYA